MKKNQVVIGERYSAKVSGNRTVVCIDNENQYGGWDATNISTGRKIHIKTAGRLKPLYLK